MYEWIRDRVLRLMKVPHEPEPPLGAPGSVRVFRAGQNHYYLRFARWVLGQTGALIGIGFSLFFLALLQAGVAEARRAAALSASAPSVTATPTPASPSASPSPQPRRSRDEQRRRREEVMGRIVAHTPSFVMPLIEFLEFLSIAFFLAQLVVTYTVVRLEFEQHWYIVTDRSLRIRTGIIRLQESTMSFANVQQVEIQQGPLQRLLGLSDVCVRSAGGSEPSAGPKGHSHEESLHVGTFKNVTNAVEIRDLIIERLRKFREAGLGDPDDHSHPHSDPPAQAATSETEAVQQLLAETRALRAVLLASPST